jgi:EpsI family protein
VSIYQLNFRLKMMAAQTGVHLSGLLGIIVERSGNQVFLQGGKSMIIANVCNGLRTLISMIAFGALYAYICKLRGLWRLLLFGLSVPVAVVVNSIRIVSLIVVADIWDAETATGWYHDTSGVLIFVLAFLMMFGLEKLILWLHKLCGRPAEVRPIFEGIVRQNEDQDQWPRLAGAFSGRAVWLAASALALTAAGVMWLARPSSSAKHFQAVKQVLPTELTMEGQRWQSYDLPLDKRSLTILDWPHYLLRRYRSGRAEVEFLLVFSRDNRLGVHPPDVCLEGGGQDIISKADLLLACSSGGKAIACRELITQDGANRQYFLYTYKCGSKYSRSFWRQQLFIMLNGLTRNDSSGALVRVSTKLDDEQQARQRCQLLLQALVPLLDQALP